MLTPGSDGGGTKQDYQRARRGTGWQRGQYAEDRFMNRSRTMADSRPCRAQRRQGCPARP